MISRIYPLLRVRNIIVLQKVFLAPSIFGFLPQPDVEQSQYRDKICRTSEQNDDNKICNEKCLVFNKLLRVAAGGVQVCRGCSTFQTLVMPQCIEVFKITWVEHHEFRFRAMKAKVWEITEQNCAVTITQRTIMRNCRTILKPVSYSVHKSLKVNQCTIG